MFTNDDGNLVTSRSKEPLSPKVKRRRSAQGFRDREKEEIKQNRTKDLDFLTSSNTHIDKNSLRAMIDDLKLWKDKIQIPKPKEEEASPKRSNQNLDSSPRSRNNNGLSLGFPTIEKLGSAENLSQNSPTPRADDRNQIREQTTGQKKQGKKEQAARPEQIKLEEHGEVRQLVIPVMKRQNSDHEHLSKDLQEPPVLTPDVQRIDTEPIVKDSLKKPPQNKPKPSGVAKPVIKMNSSSLNKTGNLLKPSNQPSNNISSYDGSTSPQKLSSANQALKNKMKEEQLHKKNAELDALYQENEKKRKEEKLRIQ